MNNNIKKFAEEVSEVIGRKVGEENIHPMDKGRYFYTQAPKKGSPMLMHHYRGPFFIDIHPDDYEEIQTGVVSPEEYIQTANWQVGYFWGGGSMIGGGYYQPMDIDGQSDEVRRYLQILSCRGAKQSNGYMPKETACRECFVDHCPFSRFKQGNWEEEAIKEIDPRVGLYNALCERFEKENPGNCLRTFYCGDTIPEDEVWVTPFGRYDANEKFAFSVSVSSKLIRSLLMRELKVEEFAKLKKSLHFKAKEAFSGELFEVNPDTLQRVYQGMDFTKKKNNPVEKPANQKEERRRV